MSQERQTIQSSSRSSSSRNKSRIDALFEGATRQIEDTTNLALKNEIEALKNRENIQVQSTEISCIKTNLEDKLEKWEGLVKQQEANLGFQKQKLGKLENLIKQKDNQIQALSDRIDALCQPVYQEIAGQSSLQLHLTLSSCGNKRGSRNSGNSSNSNLAALPETE